MIKKYALILIVMTVMFGGCNVSPLSPSNKQRINNNGEIGDIKNNQNGVMSEIAGLKSRMDLIARDVENLQSGLVNSNNKNWGVQIFQGDGGLAVGLSLAFMLALVAANYRMKSEKYKKTAELFGKQIRKLNNVDMEDRILEDAVASKIETDVYKMLKN